jgi:hypothetical protein
MLLFDTEKSREDELSNLFIKVLCPYIGRCDFYDQSNKHSHTGHLHRFALFMEQSALCMLYMLSPLILTITLWGIANIIVYMGKLKLIEHKWTTQDHVSKVEVKHKSARIHRCAAKLWCSVYLLGSASQRNCIVLHIKWCKCTFFSSPVLELTELSIVYLLRFTSTFPPKRLYKLWRVSSVSKSSLVSDGVSDP